MNQKLIPGQTEIKQTNDLVKLSHSTRHWFIKSIVRSMEINKQKLCTASRISWCDQIENGQEGKKARTGLTMAKEINQSIKNSKINKLHKEKSADMNRPKEGKAFTECGR
jgi:hypothetical protein